MESCLLCNSNPRVKIVLECDHTYCFLCIKTYSLMDDKCPECNKRFNIESYHPIINDLNISDQIDTNIDYIWVYESNHPNKWWCYDKVTNTKIEEIYNDHLLKQQQIINTDQNSIQNEFKIGHLKYELEFNNAGVIKQVNLLDKTKKRNVKRITLNNINNIIIDMIQNHNIIGVCGIKF